MDTQTLLRIVLLIGGMVGFLGLVAWAYGRPARPRFEETARQVLDDDDNPPAS